tara:strand:- start:2472 stop:3146 length:675 start_codon:yes stop_codon:yes gene_type:complete
MNSLNNFIKNIIDSLKNYTKENYKIILTLLILVFLIFIFYQYYSFKKVQDVQKNSIVYFNAKELQSNEDFYNIMEDLSSNHDFYSIISNLEMININLKNNNFNLAEKLYFDLLENDDLNSIYKSAIASHAAYSFINVININSDLSYRNLVENYFSYIDDTLISYVGIKMELKYILNVTNLDINNIALADDKETLNLYKSIMESEVVSSSIKERVSKIHEFQLYK